MTSRSYAGGPARWAASQSRARRVGGAREPGILDDLGQLGPIQLPDPARPHEHRQVPVEVRRREERVARLQQRLLVLGRADPEDDDVGVPLAGVGVDRILAGVAEEDEGPAAHLVHRVLPGPFGQVDPGQRRSDGVHVLRREPWAWTGGGGRRWPCRQPVGASCLAALRAARAGLSGSWSCSCACSCGRRLRAVGCVRVLSLCLPLGWCFVQRGGVVGHVPLGLARWTVVARSPRGGAGWRPPRAARRCRGWSTAGGR